MVIGSLELTVTFYAVSLKDKRSIVKRIVARVQSKFNVSAAEVDDNDELDRAVLGFAAAGNDAKYVVGQLDALERFVDTLELAEIVDVHREIFRT